MTSQLEAMLTPFAAISDHLAEQNKLLADVASQLKTQTELATKTHWEANKARLTVESLKTILGAALLSQVRAAIIPKQLGFMETLDLIRDEELSFARFGDGEFRMMTRLDFNVSFQKNSARLQQGLKAAIQGEGAPKLLVGMPNVFVDLHWTTVYHEVWDQVEPMLDATDRFGNSHVSRPLMFQAFGQEAVEGWKSLWAGKNVAIVTGHGSRFDLEPALFDSVASTRFEYSMPRDAFNDIEDLSRRLADGKDDLVLISLGPAGTVLAHRLAQLGKRALDIGHLSSSYNNVINGGAFPEHTPIARS
ncbi:GT-D fold domain-containing glycosyltransferase [Arthrobacter sp. UYEF20]|uniref:GT-D fold domain-containing glycosyltransferase n=1 Tax=Arthrobacter sp. UYEF20 TaxID=1756363 RepID=UPI00339AB8A4